MYMNYPDYNVCEKNRIMLKMEHEGGLVEFMYYGIPARLYYKFADEFSYCYDVMEECEDSGESVGDMSDYACFRDLTHKLEEYLRVDEPDGDPNDYNYIFTEELSDFDKK